MATIGVALSGCGVFDGAEIHESVLTLLAIDNKGHKWEILAPDIPQYHVVNHHTGEVMENEKRNVLTESARIARGPVKDLAGVKGDDYDAFIFPGGFGAAKNLSEYAFSGADAKINPDVVRVIREAVAAGRPVGLVCISPVLGALTFRGEKVSPKLTIGTDAQVAGHIEETGAVHNKCSVSEITIDEKNRIVSTPAYMLGQNTSEIAVGINKLVDAVIGLIQER